MTRDGNARIGIGGRADFPRGSHERTEKLARDEPPKCVANGEGDRVDAYRRVRPVRVTSVAEVHDVRFREQFAVLGSR